MKKYLSILILVILSCCQSTQENPFIHSVYFWFNEDVTDSRIAQFRESAKGLSKIQGVTKVYVGTAAATYRPIVERSYDLAVIVHLSDLAAHDAYQADPIHLALIESYSSDWAKVMITDVQ